MKILFIFSIFCLTCFSALAQGLQVKGTVNDATGYGLPGVTIMVEGAKTGTTTDVNGHYVIKVPANNSVLVFSSVGSLSQKVTVNGRAEINITMQDNNTSLSEVQIVGFGGVQSKASVVGSISNIEMKELRQAAPSNLSNALAGRVPGLFARQGDGAVGGVQNRYQSGGIDDAQIFIRGKSTLNNNGALVLIDGVEGSLSRINPEDIDQFSILKDASATAVYGVRGANGVILITTKKGVMGKPKINVTSQVRLNKPTDFPVFLGSYDWARLNNEALKNYATATGQAYTPAYSAADLEHFRTGDDPWGHPDVNWNKAVNKDHFTEQQHIANISGGNDKVTYYMSGEYDQSGGIAKGSKAAGTDYNYRRYNLRSNLDFNLTKTTVISARLNGLLSDLNAQATPESSGQRVLGVAWYYVVNHRPWEGQIYNPNGTYNIGLTPTWNILADLMDGSWYRRINNTLSSTFTLNQKLDFVTPGLSFRAMYGMTYNAGSTKQLNKNANYYQYDTATKTYTLAKAAAIPSYSFGDGFQQFGRTQQLEASLNYTKTIATAHVINAMAVLTQSTNESGLTLPRYFNGVAARATYAYKNKYLVEGNAGYNGSDAFNKAHRYALFPSVAVGWVASEEPFIKNNLRFLDFFKLRGSYGEVGNDRLNGNFQYFYQYVFSTPTAGGTADALNGNYSLGLNGVNQAGYREGILGNDQVTWEVDRKLDIGLEMKFFNSKLSFAADYFQDKRNNILQQRLDAPLFSALTSTKLPALNIGRVTNKGVEFSLGYSDKVGKLQYDIDGNFSYAHNNIDYRGEALQKYPWLYSTGHPIGTESLYTWTGKFYTAEDIANPNVAKPAGFNGTGGTVNSLVPGDLMFADLNGDGVINDDDRSYQGYTETPEIAFGWNVNLRYQSVYLATNWYGASHVAYRPGGALLYEFANQIQPYQADGRWVYDPANGLDTRATATYPSLQNGGSTANKLAGGANTFNKLNARYIRLRAVEFGYYLPKQWLQRIRIRDIRVFVNASNLFTWSPLNKYHIDPEYIGSTNLDGSSSGNSNGVYSPPNKFIGGGINVTF